MTTDPKKETVAPGLRESFEKWAAERQWRNFQRCPNGQRLYEITTIQFMWEAYQAGAHAPATPEWVSVKERLPEDGMRVLVLRECSLSPSIQSARYAKYHSKGADFYCGDRVTGVEHWQPLPAAPSEKPE